MDKIYNRIRRLLPVATNEQQTTNEQHPKNRAFQISFVGLFVLLLLKSGVWQYSVCERLHQIITYFLPSKVQPLPKPRITLLLFCTPQYEVHTRERRYPSPLHYFMQCLFVDTCLKASLQSSFPVPCNLFLLHKTASITELSKQQNVRT